MILRGGPGGLRATGVEYRSGDGATVVAEAAKEVILSAGAVGSPQILMLSGVGPKSELEAVGVPCREAVPSWSFRACSGHGRTAGQSPETRS